jgi:hypothetical protein
MDTDYYISQYVGGAETTTTYHRRPMSSLWKYIKDKTDATYLQLSGGTITGTLIAKTIAVKDTYGIYQFRDSNDVINAAILANMTDH